MATKIRRLSERHFDGVLTLFESAMGRVAPIEMLHADLEAGADGLTVALVAEAEDGRVVGFVNTSPHDDFDEGDDSHLDVDTLEIGCLLTTPGESDSRPKLLSTLLPAVTVREFSRVYRRVPEAEHTVFELEGWRLLPLEYGIAWNDVEDSSSVFVQMPNVGERIAVHETGIDDSAWAFPIPDDLDELGSWIVAGREFARTAHDGELLPRA